MKTILHFKTLIVISVFLHLSNYTFSQEKQVEHSHNHSHQDINMENYIASKLKNVQLIFDVDSVKGFNEIGALDQVSLGGAPEWEQKIHMSYLKRRYINTKYNLDKYASSNNKTPTVQAPCTNVGFENGTASGWTIMEGYNINSVSMAGCCSTPSTRYKIVSPGIDSNYPSYALQRVPSGGGNYALMLGDSISVYKSEVVRASQTFSVTPLNTLFIYKFAAILETAPHDCWDQPYVNISFTDASNNPISCGQFNVVQTSSQCTTTPLDQTFTNVLGIPRTPAAYTYSIKNWSTRAFDLSAYVGQYVTVAFTVSDCGQGPHPGYCYIDADCLPMSLSLNGVVLPFGQTSTVFCGATTNTLCAPSGFTYNWTGPGVTGQSGQCINPISSGSYSVSLGIIGTTATCSTVPKLYTSFIVTPNPTITIASVSSPTICRGSSTTITPGGAFTYTLNPGGLTGTSFVVSPTVTTTYSIVGTSSLGCLSVNTATTRVVVNTIPITTASTTGSITCVNNSINLNSTLSGPGITYTWTAPSGSSISGSPFTQNTTGQGLGTYTLNIKGPGGCTYSTSIAAIQNTTTPTSVSAGATQSLICGVSTVTLVGSAIPTTATASWLGGVTNPTSFTTTTGSSGTYTLLAIDLLTGCSTSSTVNVIQSIGSPFVTINPVTFSITCTNTMVPIGVVVSSTNAVTYQWPITGISGFTTSTATATLAGVYNVTVTNNPGNNCTTIKSITVPTDITPVVASITPAASITCNVPTLTLNAVPGGANYTYTWTGTPAIVSGSLTQNPIINNGGTYSVAITNTVNGCVGYASITVASNTTVPTVNVTTISTNTVIGCGVNSSVTYSANVTTVNGTPNYSWSPSGGSGGNTSPLFNATIAGTYSLLVTNTLTGCSKTNTFIVIGNSNIPNLNSAATVTTPCGSTVTVLSASSTNTNVSYTWTGPSASIITGSATSNPTVNLPGSYVVTVIDLLTGCTNSNSVTVLQTVITATFTPNPLTGFAPLTVNFTNLSTGATSYSWDFGNGLTSTDKNPTTIFGIGGTYSVILTAYEGTCSKKVGLNIIVDHELLIIIPNVFTPNGDNINDVFTIQSTGVKEMTLSIFNRWGLSLYEFSGPNAAWDGNNSSGEKVVDGTYYYLIKVLGNNGKKLEKQGTVSLFR